MKNPAANMGMLAKQGSKRILRTIGLNLHDLTEHVHPKFKQEVHWLAKNILAFNKTVEHLLINYNKNIVQEQMLLHRLANATIDIYSMLVVLSRATRGLNKNVASAENEKKMAKVICSEVGD